MVGAMPAIESPQKGFYDSRRQFQGKDEPSRDAGAPAAGESGASLPRGQLIGGLVFLFVIVLAFFAFALPQKPIGFDAPAQRPAAPAAHR
jgi:hypothetical protein